MVPSTSVPGTSTAQSPQRIPYLCTWYLVSLVDAIVCGCTACGVAACGVLSGTCYLSWMQSCVGCTTCCAAVCDVLADAGTACHDERNGKGACCSHNAHSWSQLPVRQVRIRPKSTTGYPTCVPGTWYLSWMRSCVDVRRVGLMCAMC